MRKSLANLVVWSLAVVLVVVLTAQPRVGSKKPKPDRLHGWVQTHDKDGYQFTLRVDNVLRTVTYTDDTIYTYRNEPSSFEMVWEGWRVICLGEFDKKGQLKAKRIDVREIP